EDDGEQRNSSQLSLVDRRYVHKEDHCDRICSSLLSSHDKCCRVFSLVEIKLITHDFDDALVIGKGGFGKLYKGKFNFWEGVDVAIKRSNLDSNQGTSKFSEEIEMLSKFHHRHIVSLLGYFEDSSTREMILVYEYMPNESFHHHSYKRKANGRNSSPLTQNFGFGGSRFGPANQLGTTNVYTGLIRGTFGYMDVEYLSTHRLTRNSDVYAFDVVLLETLCGRLALNFTLDEQQHSLAGWAKH
nr:serine/threonine/dual specificity protein kinase, catalytic domain-containing protein [Tanacetum cinerariifolium]